ncbi:hypothetical protein [Brachyspira sp. G79]|uniref:hypothetical protein n=1 Tax=Brachyspira sp. G79 TaxID=1358104 RepID=UPI000BBCE795|nr:hypothetical protein [Brachyspira sp. G79]PCG20427.1 hypothetical protein KQ44_10740 [Brachyspira sp. G79]
MKKIFIICLSVISIITVSCNNGSSTTNPVISDLAQFAGNYISQNIEGNYNTVTINSDSSLTIVYDNGDGLGVRTLNISPVDITENSADIYNFHYINPDTLENRLITMIFDGNFLHLNAWSTATKAILCKEGYINTDSGISAYVGKYVNGNNSIEVTAEGGLIYTFDNAVSTIQPAFVTLNTQKSNTEIDTYDILGDYNFISFDKVGKTQLYFVSQTGLGTIFNKQ